MRRHIIGTIALVCLALGAVLWFWPPGENYGQIEAVSLRLGAIMGVWWLAYPDLGRLPAWLLAAIPVIVIVLVRWPRYLVLVIPVLMLLALLKPRPRRR
jgi:hypothetical protein